MYEVLEMSWEAGQHTNALYFCKLIVLIVIYSIILNCLSFAHIISPRNLNRESNGDIMEVIWVTVE